MLKTNKNICQHCGQLNWSGQEFCSRCSGQIYENCWADQAKVNFEMFYNIFS